MLCNLNEKNEMIVFSGFISFLLLILTVFCLQLKSIGIQNHKINKLNVHIMISTFLCTAVLIHCLFVMQNFRFSSGLFAMVCLLLTILSGMILRYTLF